VIAVKGIENVRDKQEYETADNLPCEDISDNAVQSLMREILSDIIFEMEMK